MIRDEDLMDGWMDGNECEGGNGETHTSKKKIMTLLANKEVRCGSGVKGMGRGG